MTSIDPSLLWKAYPDGYLALRGVTTRDGHVVRESQSMPGAFEWHHVKSVSIPPGHPRYSPDSRLVERFEEARQRGGLLPNVDPSDVATWACLLRDLAEALPREEWTPLSCDEYAGRAPLDPGMVLTWRQGWRGEEGNGFTLVSEDSRISAPPDQWADYARWARSFPSGDVDDPTLAFVHARITARSEFGR